MEGTARQLIILVADESDDVRSAITGCLRSLGHSVTSVRSGKEARAFLDRAYFDLVITDFATADGSGLELLEETNRRYPSARVLVMVDESVIAGSMEPLAEAARKRAHGCIHKPFTPVELLNALVEIIPFSDTTPPFPGATTAQAAAQP